MAYLNIPRDFHSLDTARDLRISDFAKEREL
jgi:hypothetical protein